MKKTIKISAIVLALAVVTVALAFGSSVFATSPGRMTCLVAGLDDAAENTDVLCIMNFDFSADTVDVFQIPRDTYFNFGRSQNKINQYFSSLRAEGVSRPQAMRRLTEALENQLAIGIDGYVGVTTDVFEDAIAFLGGVYVDVEDDVELLSEDGSLILRLTKGENFINADQALSLVRYRSGYIRGDLDRLDAQKLFIRGFYKTVVRRGGYRSLANLFLTLDGVVSNISLAQVVPLIGNVPDIAGMTVTVITLPGEAVRDTNGVWYYVLNRRGAIESLQRCFPLNDEQFDKNEAFLKKDNTDFADIYNG